MKEATARNRSAMAFEMDGDTHHVVAGLLL
jgi:hypothetical protein